MCNTDNKTFPYSDEIMIFDVASGRYILTEKALLESGTDLREMLGGNDTVNADIVIRRLLRQTSQMIYNFIHSHSVHNGAQDMLIAKHPHLRPIIYNALLSQAEYLIMNGDPSKSLDVNVRRLAIDEMAKETLSQIIPGLGYSILYSGV